MSIVHLLALHSLSGMAIGSKLGKIIDYYGDSKDAWDNINDWSEAFAIHPNTYNLWRQEHRMTSLDILEKDYQSSNSRVITLEDPEYPEPLRNLSNPPYLFFCRGELPRTDDLAIALIGSRKATAYGREVAEVFGGDFGRAGVWVISGLARGIDSAGHKGVIAAGGKTVGVLGCGINVVYPKENAKLFQEVAENGAVISQFPLNTSPVPQNFPIRNEIISGLANGLVVVEAAVRSGTQITVDYALSQGKDVFAVPGSIFSPLSKGTHKMIRDDNIVLVTSVNDVLDWYQKIFKPKLKDIKPRLNHKEPLDTLTVDERKLLDFLLTQRHFNDILAEMKMEPYELSTLLTLCEMRGYINSIPGQYYVKKNI